MKTEVIPFG